MKNSLTIQIPYELATYATRERYVVTRYKTNQVIKALDTWLVLKADAPGSWIQNWNDQKQYLLQWCKCSESIFRHRLRILQGLQLITFDRHSIRLASWDTLEKVLSINVSKKFIVEYAIHSKQRIQDWIIATEIKDNQSRQAFMILKQVNKNPELNMILTGALIKAGADRNRLGDGDYFLSMLKALYLEDFVQASDIHDELISVRPDTNRGVRKMAATWNAKHAMTASYWKSVLQKAGIIDVSKLQIQSEERIRNKHCRVLWLKQPQQTLLCLCDQITVLEPWLIKKFLLAA